MWASSSAAAAAAAGTGPILAVREDLIAAAADRPTGRAGLLRRTGRICSTLNDACGLVTDQRLEKLLDPTTTTTTSSNPCRRLRRLAVRGRYNERARARGQGKAPSRAARFPGDQVRQIGSELPGYTVIIIMIIIVVGCVAQW